MQKLSCRTIRPVVAALLVLLLLLPFPGSQAQTLRDRRKPAWAHKLAADLAEQLERASSGSARMERVIAQFSDYAPRSGRAAKLARLGGRIQRVHERLGLMTVELPQDRIRELAADADIIYLSPDRPVASAGHVENTTGAALVRTLANGSGLDGAGIGIAIIDSGVDSTHRLLTRSVKHTGVLLEVDYTGNKLRGDPFGHGTHVASLSAGEAEKGPLAAGQYRGIAPGANLISLRVLDLNGQGFTSDVIAAIDWCIANRDAYTLRVINLSLGAPARDTYRRDPLCLAARRACAAGLVVVAAAGNLGRDAQGHKIYGGISSPGIDPSVITVGAANTFRTDTRSDDVVATYSSRGPTRGYYVDAGGVRNYDNLLKPDLVAPGNRLIGALSCSVRTNTLIADNPQLLITRSGKSEDRVMQLSGTSMAAPLVSGTVALMLQANPSLTPNLIKAILMYTAQPLAGYNTLEQGAGLLNVDGAVRLACLISPNVATLSNGQPMLRAPLPDPQASLIAGESCLWAQQLISGYGLLSGRDLMQFWQGMYSRSVLLADTTAAVGGTLRQLPDLTSPGVLLNSGIVFADGTVLDSGTVFADGITYSEGIVFADGRLIADCLPAGCVSPDPALSLIGDPD
jgi:subtilisin family serine protease